MRWWLLRPKRAAAPSSTVIVEECEDFLNGRYLPRLLAQDEIPTWTWLSIITHSNESDLHHLIEERPQWSYRQELLPWWHALSSIVHELFGASASTQAPILEFQRTVLVPLELLPNAYRLGPTSLARTVSIAIERQARRFRSDRNEPSPHGSK